MTELVALDNWARVSWFERAFSSEECQRTIRLAAALNSRPGAVGSAELVDTDIRRCHTARLPISADTAWLFQKIEGYASWVNDLRYKMHLCGIEESLNYVEYQSGDFYRWHQDIGGYSASLRKLSMVLLLSPREDYQGGDLKFFDFHSRIPDSQGTLIFFPAYEQHRIARIVSGTRRTLVTWFIGPPYS